MSRVAPVAPGTVPEAALVERRLVAARGQVSPLYRVLLNSVAAADGWEYFLTIVRQKLSLAPRLRELVILRIAVLNNAPYEFEAHVKHALAAGLTEEELGALRSGAHDALAALDRLVIDYTDAMTLEVHVSGALFARVEQAFAPQEVVDLTVTIGAYNMVSRVLGALGIE